MPTAGIDSHKDTLAGNPPPGNGTSKSTAGIDSHKDTLAGCVIDSAGRSIERRTFSNTPAGYRRAAAWLQAHSVGRVGIEGSGSYGRPLALFLISVGCEVVEVPTQQAAQARRQQRNRPKSDQIDALAIARIAAREDDLPVPRPQDALEDLRALVFYRRELVESRTAEIRPPPRRPYPALSGLPQPVGIGVVVFQSLGTGRQADHRRQNHQSGHRPPAHPPRPSAPPPSQKTRHPDHPPSRRLGHVPHRHLRNRKHLTAAEIIAEVGDAARYPTKARFAMANGTAPIEASSGRITRHRLNRGGNRQLNRALHNAAITQIARTGTEGRCYYKTAPPTRKNQKRSHPHPQTTHLRPGLDPPPTQHRHPPNPPSLDIGAHRSDRYLGTGAWAESPGLGAGRVSRYDHRPSLELGSDVYVLVSNTI